LRQTFGSDGERPHEHRRAALVSSPAQSQRAGFLLSLRRSSAA
jgi:hypothetical protein